MMMKKTIYMTLFVFLCGFINADIISVNICNETSPSGSSLMESDDLAGAPGVRVDNWNNWFKDDGTLGDDGLSIIDDSGIATGMTATMSPADRFATRDDNHDNDQEMFSDVIDVWAAIRTVSVSNVPYDVYDVYVYMRDDGSSRGGTFTNGGTTYYARGGVGNPGSDGTGYVLSTDTTEGNGTDVDQGNYVKFSNLSSSSFSLVMDAFYAGDATKRNKVCGFQIVAVCPDIPVADLTGDCEVNFDDLLVMISQWLMDTDPAN